MRRGFSRACEASTAQIQVPLMFARIRASERRRPLPKVRKWWQKRKYQALCVLAAKESWARCPCGRHHFFSLALLLNFLLSRAQRVRQSVRNGNRCSTSSIYNLGVSPPSRGGRVAPAGRITVRNAAKKPGGSGKTKANVANPGTGEGGPTGTFLGRTLSVAEK